MSMTAWLGSTRERACFRALVAKQAVPACLLLLFGWLVIRKAGTLDFDAIFAAVQTISAAQWSVAICAATVSFWAIGRMDAVIHRLVGTAISDTAAQLSGIAAVATAQLTGFGLLTGTLARWRILPDLSLLKAAQITGAVCVAFMAALGVLAAAMVLAIAPDIPWARPIALLGLAATALAALGTIWRPRALLRVKLPPLRAQVSLLAFALLDTGAAALTLYILIPEAQVPPPAVFYTVFLLALGAGLLGATPGGVGPFEMMFLWLLPQVPEAPMLAAIMGYRLVYFALPAVFATVFLLFGPALGMARTRRNRPALRPADSRPGAPVATGALSFNAGRAEAGLMRQGEFELLYDDRGAPVSLVAQAGQSLIMLSDPLGPHQCRARALDMLQRAAHERYLVPCLYKCSGKTAVAARQAGWRVLTVAREARVAPFRFDLSAPAHRQLRRHLRRAESGGIEVAEAGARPPFDAMREIATDWGRHRGQMRGFSMGRFDEGYVSAQRVYLARHRGDLVGFISLHEGWTERALDLMCHRPGAPAGTMHLLVYHAIRAAADDGCTSLSLAAVPNAARALALPSWLTARIDGQTGAPGLERFKQCFAPTWRPLYLAAPNGAGVAVAALDLVDRITRPRPNS